MSRRTAVAALLLAPLLAFAQPNYKGFTVVGKHVTTLGFHGSASEGLEALAAASKGPMFLFERNGVKYVVRDPEVVRAAESAVATSEQLNARQSELGAQQQQLSDRQSALSQQMSAATYELAGEHDGARRDALTGKMRSIGDQMREVGQRQQSLAQQQHAIGEQQKSAADQEEAALKKLADSAYTSGKALHLTE